MPPHAGSLEVPKTTNMDSSESSVRRFEDMVGVEVVDLSRRRARMGLYEKEPLMRFNGGAPIFGSNAVANNGTKERGSLDFGT